MKVRTTVDKIELAGLHNLSTTKNIEISKFNMDKFQESLKEW